MKKLLNRKGVIALVTMLILAAVGVLGIAMVVTSQLNSTAANNYRYKIQTYNAADGMMTLLAQDIIDWNEDRYFIASNDYFFLHANVPATGGNPSDAGGYRHGFPSLEDTVYGSGSMCGKKDSTKDYFHYAYSQKSGDFVATVKLNSLDDATNAAAKGGIMVRKELTNNSKFFMICMTKSNGLAVQYRTTTAATQQPTLTPAKSSAFPIWLRISRVGNVFTGFYSTDGSTWTSAYNVTAATALGTEPYVGLIACSYVNGTPIKAAYSNASGLGGIGREALDTVKVGSDSIMVFYRIQKTSDNIFNLAANAYIEKGAAHTQNYITKLNQGLSRMTSGGWRTSTFDSALVPVTLYDFRSDLSCPEFGQRSEICPNKPTASCPTPGFCGKECLASGDNPVVYFVQDTLDTIRKPLLKENDSFSAFRDTFIKGYDSIATPWYTTMTKDYRLHKTGAEGGAGHFFPNEWKTKAYNCNNYKAIWDFCDSLSRWFRPWGDSAGTSGAYLFDTLTGKWSGLKRRPNAIGGAPTPDNGWVTEHWDSNHHFANIVIYDTLIFRQYDKTIDATETDTTIFSFGKSYWATGADIKWFLNCTDFATGEKPKFMPLKNKGFKNDWLPKPTSPAPSACALEQNFGFTMEMHRKFTYKPNQTFEFTGDDDVWVFINNKLVIDLGGHHTKTTQKVNLDDLHLESGEEYWFDFFYCERAPTASNILITTNMALWLPPKPLKRSWKRDYGPLD